MNLLLNKDKVLYLHGRPASHIMHERLAKQVAGKFMPIDPVIRWHDKNIWKPFIPIAWFINALYIVIVRREKTVLVSGLHITAVLIKYLSFGRKKIIAHLGDQNLYFLYSDWYKPRAEKMLRYTLRNFNAVMCEGKMGQELLQGLLKERAPKNYSTFLGVPRERQMTLEKNTPNLQSHNLLLIAAGWQGWRYWYKGLDLMIESFEIAAAKDAALKFTILGYWPESVIKKLTERCKYKDRIIFAGRTSSIETYLQDAGLYFHCSRGDAFPTSVLESMTAGLPALVSKWTGSKEYIEPTAKEFVCNLDKIEIANKLEWYMQLPLEDKQRYSAAFRKTALYYTEETALQNYIRVFNQVVTDLGVKK